MFHDGVENRSVVRVVVGVVDVDGVDVVGKVVKKSDVGLKSVDCDWNKSVVIFDGDWELLNVVAVVVGMVVIGVAVSDVFEKGVVVGVGGGIDEDDWDTVEIGEVLVVPESKCEFEYKWYLL